MPAKNLSPKKVASAGSYRRSAATELMEFFYSVHYEIGTALEDVVRADVLSRQQAAILWLIRSQGDGGVRMRRKDIESNVRRWFEVTSAALSKSLRAMMHAPLELIEITEDPRSGREKLVALTLRGKAFLEVAATKAGTVLAELIEDAPLDVIDNAITYFRYLTGAFQSSQGRSRVRLIQLEDRAGRKLKGTGVTGITKGASVNAESKGARANGETNGARGNRAAKNNRVNGDLGGVRVNGESKNVHANASSRKVRANGESKKVQVHGTLNGIRPNG
jgi:DNA-binding MarR family transcriptional regulator